MTDASNSVRPIGAPAHRLLALLLLLTEM